MTTYSSVAQLPCLASESLLKNPAAGMWVQLSANRHSLSVEEKESSIQTHKATVPTRVKAASVHKVLYGRSKHAVQSIWVQRGAKHKFVPSPPNPHLDSIPPLLLSLGVSTAAAILVYFFIGFLLVIRVFIICGRRTVLVS